MSSPSPLQQPQLSPFGTPRAPPPTQLADASTPTTSIRTEKVWVGVRIRPLLRHEVEAKETVAWRAANATTLACLAEEKTVYQPSSYQYDRVFADSCSSEEVYSAAAQPMVRSAMRGYNCTLFAYGQTGSGKTTTMRSVMQHASKDIFEHIAQARDREFVLKMCAIEVYNEVVHDLFVEGDTNLKINDDKEKGPVVMDLTEQSIESEEHLVKLLKAVEGRRQVRETKMNQKSSRSHMVVRLYVESRPAAVPSDDEDGLSSDDSSEGGDTEALPAENSAQSLAPVLSTINFVDLAGSERLSQASMTDDATAEKLRTKEASNINVSLLTLGKVIRALGKRGEHVPYRESNLTRILQPSLSGNSRMAIVCTLSPAAGSVENSRAALHFANHAKAVTMRPVLNEVRGEQALIHKMEVEIMELRRKLARMDRGDRGTRTGTKQLLAEKDAEIKAKEEQMRQALQERAALERRLNQMEKFIIRGGTSSPSPAVRRSFDGLESLATSIAGGNLQNGQGRGIIGCQATASGVGVRASWTPSNPSPLDGRERQSAGKSGRPGLGLGGTPSRSVANPNRLLLDYLLPPNVRDAVLKLGGDTAASRSTASPAVGRAGHGADGQAYPSAFNLRLEIGKLQAPEGSKAQEALSALQAEVRCFSQQPDAAAAVAAAVGATPDTADRLLQQLTLMLSNMERRQQDGQSAGGEEPAAATAAGASGSVPAATPTSIEEPQPGGQTPGTKQQQQREAAGASPEEEAGLISLLRTEVARLQRLRAINVQANQAIESLLGKMAELEHAGVAGSQAQLDTVLQMPGVLERLHSALQEADTLEEGDEELAADEVEAAAAADGGEARTPQRSRGGAAAAEDGEATSAHRYDSPTASAQTATAATTTAAPQGPSPSRLTGTKLPRGAAGHDLCDDEDGCGELVKSPRRGLLASPHTAAAGTTRRNSLTPNSRGMPLPASVSAGGAAGHVPGGRVPPLPPSARHGVDSPRALADGEDLTLRRMRTPSVSIHASDGDPPMSGGRRTASASSRGGLLRWDTERARRIISREKDAIHAWYSAEVSRLQAAFRNKAQADVDAMREAVERYRGMFEETQERVERLNLQKQLLIKQVLQLELTADEAEQQEARNQGLIAKLTAERDQARFEAAQAQSRAQAAQLQAQRAQALMMQQQQQQPAVPPRPSSVSSEQHPFYDEDDDWADAPTSETLLAKICELWHKLHVPLVYRSRFFLLFRSKELIYLQMEQRRLKHRLEQIEKEMEADYLARSKPLDKAKRALDLERKVLAQALRYAYSDRDRETLYATWDVKPNSKGRKLQLLRKLWEPAATRDQSGMEASAQVVCALAGPDATEQFMQLVFGNTAEVCARPTHVGALVSTLVRRVTTPRQRKGPAGTAGGGAGPPSSLGMGGPGGASALASSTATSAGYYLNAGAAPTLGNGGVTPRRQSSGLLASIAGRVGSMIGQQGQSGAKQQPTGAQAGGGTAPQSGAATPRSVASGPVQQLPPNTQIAAAAGGGPPAPALGPMARGLAIPGVGQGTNMPPLPPPHSSILANVGGAAPPLSMRGRATYAGSSRP